MRKLRNTIQSWGRSLNRKYLHPGYELNYPDQINIETASICNLHCSCCPHGVAQQSMRTSGVMTPDTFNRVLEHLDIPLKHAFLHLHGEPFLNPHLASFVDEITRRQIRVNLYSNCTIFDETQLDTILNARLVTLNYSVDLLFPEYYEGIRTGARYHDTLDNLDLMNRVFSWHKMFFNIIIIVDSSLADHIDGILRCFEMLYSRYSQLNGILLGSRFPWPRLPWTGDLSGHLVKGHMRCSHAFEGLSILWNGDATMCSFDYTGECVVGSLIDNTYSEVYNNRAARAFRTSHWRHKDSELPLCGDCLLDRYVPASATIHRSVFLRNDKNEAIRIIQAFFQSR